MTTLQRQARALGDPTRHAIFRHIADAAEPVGVAELTDDFKFNHNAIRQHLSKLVESELVIENTVRTAGPGRPRLMYRVHPLAESRWGVTGPYERLSHLLTEIIASGDTPVEVGRRASNPYAIAPSPADRTVTDIASAMALQGFDPEIRNHRGGADIILRSCPFQSAALLDPDVVCSLHLGLAEGLAQKSNAVAVEELVTNDPTQAPCTLRLAISAKP